MTQDEQIKAMSDSELETMEKEVQQQPDSDALLEDQREWQRIKEEAHREEVCNYDPDNEMEKQDMVNFFDDGKYRDNKRTITVKTIAITEDKDSLEIGTAGKGGAIKVYCDFNNLELAREKIKRAYEARKYAQSLEGN